MFFSLLFPHDEQPRNQEFKYQVFKYQVSSTNFNSLNSLITLQVQEFKLQAPEPKFQVQAFQVSSTGFKIKTEKRFYITLTLKRGQRPKSFHNPNPAWRKIFIMVLTQLQTTAFFESPDQLASHMKLWCKSNEKEFKQLQTLLILKNKSSSSLQTT